MPSLHGPTSKTAICAPPCSRRPHPETGAAFAVYRCTRAARPGPRCCRRYRVPSRSIPHRSRHRGAGRSRSASSSLDHRAPVRRSPRCWECSVRGSRAPETAPVRPRTSQPVRTMRRCAQHPLGLAQEAVHTHGSDTRRLHTSSLFGGSSDSIHATIDETHFLSPSAPDDSQGRIVKAVSRAATDPAHREIQPVVSNFLQSRPARWAPAPSLSLLLSEALRRRAGCVQLAHFNPRTIGSGTCFARSPLRLFDRRTQPAMRSARAGNWMPVPSRASIERYVLDYMCSVRDPGPLKSSVHSVE